ncbi:MAG: hypothetical protein JXR72_01250, partial [Proteobacteria bacterium]|nr:hypothetical protein [Pseudomonadota bacterium]
MAHLPGLRVLFGKVSKRWRILLDGDPALTGAGAMGPAVFLAQLKAVNHFEEKSGRHPSEFALGNRAVRPLPQSDEKPP